MIYQFFSAVLIMFLCSLQVQAAALVEKNEMVLHGTPQSVAWGDMNGDSFQDMLVASTDENELVINWAKNGSKSGEVVFYEWSSVPLLIKAVDVDLDTRDELIVLSQESKAIEVLKYGAGGLISFYTLDLTFQPSDVLLEDLNFDGYPDMIVVSYDSRELNIYFGDGIGGFVFQEAFKLAIVPNKVVLADINLDQVNDILIFDAEVGIGRLLQANGNGSFTLLLDNIFQTQYEQYGCEAFMSVYDESQKHLSVLSLNTQNVLDMSLSPSGVFTYDSNKDGLSDTYVVFDTVGGQVIRLSLKDTISSSSLDDNIAPLYLSSESSSGGCVSGSSSVMLNQVAIFVILMLLTLQMKRRDQ